MTCIDGGVVEAPSSAPLLIIITGIIGILFALHLLNQVASVKLDVTSVPGSKTTGESKEQNSKLVELYEAIRLGANSFLNAEYKLCALFVVVVFPAMAALIAWGAKTGGSWGWSTGVLSGVSFLVGALTSMVSGWIGTM